MKKIWVWLKLIIISIGTILISFLGYKITKSVLAQIGKVENSDNFSLIPDDNNTILVSKKDSPKEQIEVTLPEGIRSSEVRAVKIVSATKAIVEIL